MNRNEKHINHFKKQRSARLESKFERKADKVTYAEKLMLNSRFGKLGTPVPNSPSI